MPIPDARGQHLFGRPAPDLRTQLSSEVAETAGSHGPKLRSLFYVVLFMGFGVLAILAFAVLALLAMGVVGA